MPNSRVDWYAEDVLLVVDDVTEEALLALAFQVEAEAKVNAPVDTGFLRNSSYVAGGDTNTFRSQSANGRNTVNRAEPSPPNGAVVGFGADYSIFVESRQPFLYPAAQQVMQQAEGTIAAVGRRHF